MAHILPGHLLFLRACLLPPKATEWVGPCPSRLLSQYGCVLGVCIFRAPSQKRIVVFFLKRKRRYPKICSSWTTPLGAIQLFEHVLLVKPHCKPPAELNGRAKMGTHMFQEISRDILPPVAMAPDKSAREREECDVAGTFQVPSRYLPGSGRDGLLHSSGFVPLCRRFRFATDAEAL